MDLDEEICHCNHVSLRKLLYFARRVKPVIPSQMSECLGAGTGCGKCVQKLHLIAAMYSGPDEDLLRELVERWPYG